MPSSSPAVLATVQWAEEQNIPIVPVYIESKAAADPGYPKPDWKPPQLVYYTVNRRNVGAVLGPKLGGLVDVDIDALDITDIIEAFFPATEAIFGRASKSRSHRLYRVDAAEFPSLKYTDPLTNQVIFELRGDGGLQTVLPGSVHETKEAVEWAHGAPPAIVATVSVEQLTRARMLSAVCILIRRYIWLEGMRDEGSHHTSGLLFKLGWSECDVLDVFRVAAAGDWDHKAEMRIKRTYKQFTDKKIVSGAKGLLDKKLVDAAVINAFRSWAGASDAVAVDEYNDRFAAGLVGSQFRIALVDVHRDEPLVLVAKKDFIDLTAADRVPITIIDKKGVPSVKLAPKAELWLKNLSHRQFSDLRFLPGTENDDLPSGTLNLWTGWPIAPDSAGSCAAWLELLWTVICGEDAQLYNWILHWFANIVREPMNRTLTALVLISDLEGAGKTLLLTYFGRILGRGYVPVHNAKHVTGTFNRHLTTGLLLHSEEALYPGNHEHAAIIRSLITDPYRMFEPKFYDAVRVDNFIRMAFSSNKLHAASPQPGDRRHTVAYLENRKLDDDLLRRIKVEMADDSGPAALFHLLLTMDYDPQLARTNIKNEALTELKQIASEPHQQWWYKRLWEGHVLDADLFACKQPHGEPWPSVVSFTALCASAKLFYRENNYRRQFNEQHLKGELQKMTNIRFLGGRLKFNYMPVDNAPPEFRSLGDITMRQYAITNLPSLSDCRRAYELFIDPSGATTFDWPPPPTVDDDGI